MSWLNPKSVVTWSLATRYTFGGIFQICPNSLHLNDLNKLRKRMPGLHLLKLPGKKRNNSSGESDSL